MPVQKVGRDMDDEDYTYFHNTLSDGRCGKSPKGSCENVGAYYFVRQRDPITTLFTGCDYSGGYVCREHLDAIKVLTLVHLEEVANPSEFDSAKRFKEILAEKGL